MDLTFLLTEECNLRCRYCYQKNYPRTVLPVPWALEAIRTALDRGAQELALTFFGGEPLLRADALFSILSSAREMERARRIPITAKVSTNGLALTEEILHEAARLGLFISLSHDGTREAMDAGRVGPDGSSCFERVERALQRLVEARLPFAVYSVVTPANVRFLERSQRHLWDRGARILILAIDYSAEWTPPTVAELVRQYEALGDFYRSLLKERRYTHLEPFDSRIPQRTRPGEMRRCAPGVRQLTVAPDGTLYGCVEYAYRRLRPLGTVCTWLDPQRVRELCGERSPRPPECRECALITRCNNNCACINLRATGRPDVPPASLCLTEQETIRAVDRLAAKLYRQRLPEFLMRHYSSAYPLLFHIEKLFQDMGIAYEPA